MGRRGGSGDNETGRDGFPSECPWPIDDVLSEVCLPTNTSALRYVNLRALAPDIDATYIRVDGKSGARIRCRRISVGRHTKGLNVKSRAKIARMAYMICVLAPDSVDTILTMPSRRLGRLVKAVMRRARMSKHAGGLVGCRPASTVFRIRNNKR